MQNTGYSQKIDSPTAIARMYDEQTKAQAAQAQGLQPPARQREVEEWMNRLYSNLEKLESLTSTHIERLGFISRQGGTGESKESAPEAPLVPLANSLRSVSQRIGRLMVQISDATDNLEIP